MKAIAFVGELFVLFFVVIVAFFTGWIFYQIAPLFVDLWHRVDASLNGNLAGTLGCILVIAALAFCMLRRRH